MVALASILDGSDGEIARLKQQRSPFGGYFDAVLDRYADTAMLATAAVFAWREVKAGPSLPSALRPWPAT